MARAAGCEPEPLDIVARRGVVPRLCSDPLSPEPEPLASTPSRLYSAIEPDSRRPWPQVWTERCARVPGRQVMRLSARATRAHRELSLDRPIPCGQQSGRSLLYANNGYY